MIVPNQPEESSQTASPMAGVFLAIEGPIGVGKTTLARLLHETWQAELVLEHFDENPFLPLFYTDRQRYAWQTQLHFLIDRFDQWSELRSTPPLRVSDYLFDKDRLFAELNLNDVALRRYRPRLPRAPQPPAPADWRHLSSCRRRGLARADHGADTLI